MASGYGLAARLVFETLLDRMDDHHDAALQLVGRIFTVPVSDSHGSVGRLPSRSLPLTMATASTTASDDLPKPSGATVALTYRRIR